MKKDYMPVAEGDLKHSETAFVEQHWTKIWQDKAPTSVSETIEKREAFRMMKSILSSLPPKSRILDGGCGLGEWTLYLASRGFHVVGLDISRLTIGKLQQMFPDRVFISGDIRSTEFEDEYFDLYFSWGTFEHFENGLGDPLREARRILKVGGYLFISVPFQNNRHLRRDNRQLWLWDQNYDKHKGYQSKMRFYQWRLTKPELQREFEVNGFRTVKVEAIDKLHGVRGTVRYDLHTNPDSTIGKAMQAILYALVPTDYVAHMLVGIAQKT